MILKRSNGSRCYINPEHIISIDDNDPTYIVIMLDSGTSVTFDKESFSFDDFISKLDAYYRRMNAIYGGNKR